jgi:hypothetical protein
MVVVCFGLDSVTGGLVSTGVARARTSVADSDSSLELSVEPCGVRGSEGVGEGGAGAPLREASEALSGEAGDFRGFWYARMRNTQPALFLTLGSKLIACAGELTPWPQPANITGKALHIEHGSPANDERIPHF